MNTALRSKSIYSTEEKLSIGIILVFHLVGIILLNFTKGSMYYFALDLVPLNIIFTVLLMMKSQKNWNKGLLIFTLSSVIVGFLVEVVGVNSGIIFGKYKYGEVLGFKLFNTPLLIGLNWFLLTYSAGCLVEKIRIGSFFKASISTFLLVLLDYLMEPVAMKHNFWSWHNGNIPEQNYIGWFFTSFLLSLLFQFTNWSKQNAVASAVFIIQFAFFLFQNIL